MTCDVCFYDLLITFFFLHIISMTFPATLPRLQYTMVGGGGPSRSTASWHGQDVPGKVLAVEIMQVSLSILSMYGIHTHMIPHLS